MGPDSVHVPIIRVRKPGSTVQVMPVAPEKCGQQPSFGIRRFRHGLRYSFRSMRCIRKVHVHGDFLRAVSESVRSDSISEYAAWRCSNAHTARGSLCLGSWAARAAYTRCSLQPAPNMPLCLSDHSAAHTASRCCRLRRRDCSGTGRFSCSDSDDICPFHGRRRRGSLPQLPHCRSVRGLRTSPHRLAAVHDGDLFDRPRARGRPLSET